MVQENEANLRRNLAKTTCSLFVVCVWCVAWNSTWLWVVAPNFFFGSPISLLPKGMPRQGKKGGLRKRNLTQRRVSWWSCRIKLARSQQIGSICMCYAMRIHKAPPAIACKGKVSAFSDAAVFCKGYVRKSPSLASFPQEKQNILVYFFFPPYCSSEPK